MAETITIPKGEYLTLKKKAKLLDNYIENDELTKEELDHIKKALQGPSLTEEEFLKKHSELV